MNKNFIAFRIKSLNNQIKRLMDKSALVENDANLNGAQYAVLGFLSEKLEEGSVYQKDIEYNFNIRRSTASEMLKLLESNGLIERTTDEKDTRLKKIILTDRAQELNMLAQSHIISLEKRLTKGLSSEEIDTFLKIIDKISENAQD